MGRRTHHHEQISGNCLRLPLIIGNINSLVTYWRRQANLHAATRTVQIRRHTSEGSRRHGGRFLQRLCSSAQQPERSSSAAGTGACLYKVYAHLRQDVSACLRGTHVAEDTRLPRASHSRIHSTICLLSLPLSRCLTQTQVDSILGLRRAVCEVMAGNATYIALLNKDNVQAVESGILKYVTIVIGPGGFLQ